MDSQQARLILSCRRPRGQDDADPAIREALEAARRDPELAAWLEREQEIDALLGAKLSALPAPPDLRTEILAGQTLVRPAPAFWQRPPAWLAAAACLVLGLGVALWMKRTDAAVPGVPLATALPPATFSDMRKDVAGLVLSGFQPQNFTPGLDAAREILAGQQAPSQIELPPFLGGATAYACSVIEWRGRKVAGVCLVKEGRSMHLFVLPKSQLDAVPGDGEILTAQAGGLSTLAWNAADSFYVLVGDTPDVDVRPLIGGT